MKPLFSTSGPWSQLLVFLFMWLVFALLSSGVSLLVLPLLPSDDGLLWCQFVSQLIMFAAPAFLFGWFYRGNPISYMHLEAKKTDVPLFLLPLGVMLLLSPVIDRITIWNEGLHFPLGMEAIEDVFRQVSQLSEQFLTPYLQRSDFVSFIQNILILAICPAICEEIFFRGVLQQVVGQCVKNVFFSIFITAVIFSLAHGDLFAFVPRMLLGIVLGYLFYWTDCIWVNVIAHFVNNAAVVVLYWLYVNNCIAINPSSPFNYSWVVVLFSLCVAMFLLVLIWIIAYRKTGNVKK